jgi:acyl carrier protein
VRHNEKGDYVGDLTASLARAAERQERCRAVIDIIVDRLGLPVDPAWITNDQPLFGRGLELDSVDALELIVGIEMEFDVSITDDEMEVFGSINTDVDRIEQEIG